MNREVLQGIPASQDGTHRGFLALGRRQRRTTDYSPHLEEKRLTPVVLVAGTGFEPATSGL